MDRILQHIGSRVDSFKADQAFQLELFKADLVAYVESKCVAFVRSSTAAAVGPTASVPNSTGLVAQPNGSFQERTNAIQQRSAAIQQPTNSIPQPTDLIQLPTPLTPPVSTVNPSTSASFSSDAIHKNPVESEFALVHSNCTVAQLASSSSVPSKRNDQIAAKEVDEDEEYEDEEEEDEEKEEEEEEVMNVDMKMQKRENEDDYDDEIQIVKEIVKNKDSALVVKQELCDDPTCDLYWCNVRRAYYASNDGTKLVNMEIEDGDETEIDENPYVGFDDNRLEENESDGSGDEVDKLIEGYLTISALNSPQNRNQQAQPNSKSAQKRPDSVHKNRNLTIQHQKLMLKLGRMTPEELEVYRQPQRQRVNKRYHNLSAQQKRERNQRNYEKVKKSMKPNKFECKFTGCGQSFPTKFNLINHERIHLDIKPFSCGWPKCRYSAESRGNVTQHVRSRHFHLPLTKKEQESLNIVDDRNPNDYIQVNPHLLTRRLQ